MKITKDGNSSMMYIDVGGKQFCLSYNIPIGFVDFTNEICYITNKKWSSTTSKHLSHWKQKFGLIQIKEIDQEEISFEWNSIC